MNKYYENTRWVCLESPDHEKNNCAGPMSICDSHTKINGKFSLENLLKKKG